MTAYTAFAAQALKYFMRPHSAVPQQPIAGAANWRGKDMASRMSDWRVDLTPGETAELSEITDRLMSSKISMGDINRALFPLPKLESKIAEWRDAVSKGRGFIVIGGLPVQEWGEAKSAYAYWGLGHHFGTPGAQNPQDELLGHVIDYGEETDNPIVRRYRTAGNIDFHCDAADAVGLLCLRAAKSGGQSRIVSSVAVFNEVFRREPDLIPRLFEPFWLDRRDEQGEGEPAVLPIPPCRFGADGKLRTFYHSEYFRSAERHEGVIFDAAAMRLLDLYDEICLLPEFQLDMWLRPGDMQFVSNHTIVHSRTEYEDWPEPERKRHLLRLWLSLDS